MDLYEALYTTRAMRRTKPDPIPEDVVKRMLDAAIRAPSGGNTQQWRWIAVTDPSVIERLGVLYAEAFDEGMATFYSGREDAARAAGDDQSVRVMTSSRWLRDNFGSLPLVVVAYTRNDPDGSSIYPAVWNLMLAARGQGVGTTLTTFLNYFRHAETAGALDVPTDKGWKLAATVTCGYPLGRWDVASRPPVTKVAFSDRWGNSPAWTVDEPLWETG